MSKEQLAGAIKVGFAQWRVDYTETVYDDLIWVDVIEHKFDSPRDAESDLRRRRHRGR